MYIGIPSHSYRFYDNHIISLKGFSTIVREHFICESPSEQESTIMTVMVRPHPSHMRIQELKGANYFSCGYCGFYTVA